MTSTQCQGQRCIQRLCHAKPYGQAQILLVYPTAAPIRMQVCNQYAGVLHCLTKALTISLPTGTYNSDKGYDPLHISNK